MSIPADLALLVRFVNTLDLEGARDDLDTPRALSAWLAGEGLAPTSVRATRADVRASAEVREAIRTLLLSHNEDGVDTAPAAAVLERTGRRARLELVFDSEGPASVEARAGGAHGALGRIVAAVARASATPEWSRLKACRAHDCRWAFYDQARNRSRAWCSMRVCGNREKARVWRERHLN